VGQEIPQDRAVLAGKLGRPKHHFKHPGEVRKIIYTTNATVHFNRQLRKVTKSKSVFPTDDILLKMLYLAMMDIMKKWTGRRQDWGLIHSQLEVFLTPTSLVTGNIKIQPFSQV
jgi:hypothetical protein